MQRKRVKETNKPSFSKKEADLLLNIVESESIKLDSIKSNRDKKALAEPRQVLESLRKKLPMLLLNHAYNL